MLWVYRRKLGQNWHGYWTYTKCDLKTGSNTYESGGTRNYENP